MDDDRAHIHNHRLQTTSLFSILIGVVLVVVGTIVGGSIIMGQLAHIEEQRDMLKSLIADNKVTAEKAQKTAEDAKAVSAVNTNILRSIARKLQIPSREIPR